jgi:cytolysin (calcineurin-like family phosphatase)
LKPEVVKGFKRGCSKRSLDWQIENLKDYLRLEHSKDSDLEEKTTVF